jgi:site-specific recombinase XerD
MPEITRAKTLHQGQFNRLIKITQATSRYPERDVLVLILGHHCGMRITEISRLTVADVMHASGKLRSEISMREAITKGCRQRCAYLASKPAIQALETYLQYRIERGIGTVVGSGPYRDLLPHQPLIYSSRGDGMSQNTKRRVLETGEEKAYRACDSLQAHVTMAVPARGHQGWFQPFRTPHVRQQGAGHHGRHGGRGTASWAHQYRLLAALRGC